MFSITYDFALVGAAAGQPGGLVIAGERVSRGRSSSLGRSRFGPLPRGNAGDLPGRRSSRCSSWLPGLAPGELLAWCGAGCCVASRAFGEIFLRVGCLPDDFSTVIYQNQGNTRLIESGGSGKMGVYQGTWRESGRVGWLAGWKRCVAADRLGVHTVEVRNPETRKGAQHQCPKRTA